MHAYLEINAAKYPERIAVLEGKVSFTYADLLARVRALAGVLDRAGSRPGDQVVISLTNVHEFVVAYFAVSMTGCIPVLMAGNLPASKRIALIEEVRAKGVIAHSWMAPFLASPPPVLEFVILDRQPASHEHPPLCCQCMPEPGDSTAPFFSSLTKEVSKTIIFTSGSTGQPKGVILLRENLEYGTSVIIDFLDLTHEDRTLVSMPFTHCAGLLHLLASIRCGASLVTGVSSALSGSLLKAVSESDVTGLPIMPSLAKHLFTHYPEALARYGNRLRFIELSSEPYDATLIEQLNSSLSNTAIFNTYGLTEALRATYHHIRGNGSVSLSAGTPNRGVQIQIIDSRGNKCQPGEIGEIFIKGPNIASGYLSQPEDTDRVFTYKGVKSGDLGYRDLQGRIYLQGRKGLKISMDLNNRLLNK